MSTVKKIKGVETWISKGKEIWELFLLGVCAEASDRLEGGLDAQLVEKVVVTTVLSQQVQMPQSHLRQGTWTQECFCNKKIGQSQKSYHAFNEFLVHGRMNYL